MTDTATVHRTGPGGEPTDPRERRRRRRVYGLAAAAVVGAAVVAILSVAFAPQESAGGSRPFQGATEEVVSGDLAGSTTVSGTLRFAPGQTVLAGAEGVVTDLPGPGSVVAPGQRLYALDNQPVFLLRGELPAWRDFAVGMDDGPDVKQLEQNLRRLGFFDLDLDPDEYFSSSTSDAIEQWQEANNLETTGRLPLGSVVFASRSLRVSKVEARLGDRVGPGSALIGTTSTTQVVEMDVNLIDQQLAVVDKPVRLRLPGGAMTGGRIYSVGTPTQKTGADGEDRTVIPVVVRLRHPADAASFQEATVTVDLPSQRRKGVLSVPIGALLALAPERFGIEVVNRDGSTRKVTVRTGLFAAGRVEVSGTGVEAGLRVVVPQR